jgi:hypothetical protein
MLAAPKTRTLGVVFSALILSGTVTTTIGACVAYAQKAPTWAFFLFFGGLMGNIPLGGVIGYLFRGSSLDELDETR